MGTSRSLSISHGSTWRSSFKPRNPGRLSSAQNYSGAHPQAAPLRY